METNFSSDGSKARQANTNFVDRLLAVDEVDMEAEFFERLLETTPAFRPGLSEGVDCSISLPVSPSNPTLVSPTSPSPSHTKPPASPGSLSSSDSSFVFSVSPVRPQPSSPALETPRAPWQSPSVLDTSLSLSLSSAVSESSPSKISSQALVQLLTGDLIYSRQCPVSPGLALQPTQGSPQPPPKKLKLSGRDQDLNANIAEEAGAGEVERSNLIRELAEKFLLAVPSGPSGLPRASLKPAGDCTPVTQEALGEDPVQLSFSSGSQGWTVRT